MTSDVEIRPSAGDAEGLKQLRDALAARMAGRHTMTMDDRRASFGQWMASICPMPANVRVVETASAGVPALEIELEGRESSFDIVHFHGGAFVSGSPRTHMEFAARLAQAAGARVIVPHYRLAPEWKFPCAVEDAVAVTTDILSRDRARPVALSGDSAGSNLAINAVVAAARMNAGAPFALALQSPFVDLSLTASSIEANASIDPFLSRSGLTADVARYVPADIDIRTPSLSPLLADLAALPPTLIQVGTAEILLDDSTRLASALQAAGVPVVCERWLDMTHNWHLFPNWLLSAEAGTRSIATFLLEHASRRD